MDNQNENKTWTLACGVQGCCPTVEFTGDGVVLRDDYNGMVKLTSAEWGDLVAKVNAGDVA